MSQAINLIITCEHVDCPYNYEKECGKEILYVDDAECMAQGRKRGIRNDGRGTDKENNGIVE